MKQYQPFAEEANSGWWALQLPVAYPYAGVSRTLFEAKDQPTGLRVAEACTSPEVWRRERA